MVDPEDVVSTLTYQDVERFKSVSYFPSHWECYVPGPEDGGLSTEPHFSLCLYEDMFRAEVRFPLHPSICEILNFYNVCPAQLAPNAWKVIIGFVTLASSMSLPVSAAVFSKMYKIQRHPGCSGVWYFTSDKTTSLLLECSDGNRNWKSKFFYVIASRGMEMQKSRKFNKDKLAARAVQRQASGPSRRRVPRPLPGGSLAPGSTVLTPTADVGQLSGVPSPITRKEASAATDAPFQGLADDGYALLAQQLFTNQGLIAKVNYGSRRVMELATEVSQGEGRVKHLEGEVTDLQGCLASVELEREELRKENEALKLSAKEVEDAAEEAQMGFYLDGFDDCKQMACIYFPAIDFGRLVPCPPAPASGVPTTDMETAEGSPSPVDE
ncbi:hypothetical protein PHJA_000796900 [Phtheirospermum japonicum]|uniref:Transposase (putative) gypsy type domain-containing protein n=1 Tax=Phtheirospermum japonicum TaxID=374723 RepID=A0A830BWN6_9LAMI|nr:hypothetical protein PHJA_000796900 [Phtheirospermum japonicum]